VKRKKKTNFNKGRKVDNKIIDIKGKLENLEKELNQQDLNVKDEKVKKVDDQMAEYIKSKDSVINLNIGGKIFQTKISTLLSVRDSIFYHLVSECINENQELSKEIFFDRSFHHFNFILDYLRTKKYTLKVYTTYDLNDIYEELEFYGITEILLTIDDMRKEVEFIGMEGTSPTYPSCGTHRYQDLKDKTLLKGICAQAPYDIILELNMEHEIVGMEIGGCIANVSTWPANTGVSAKVSTSIDRSTWKEVGIIPSTFGATIVKADLTPSRVKFIKFHHSSHIGIGYLHLLKR